MTTAHATGQLHNADAAAARVRVLSLHWELGELPASHQARLLLVGRTHSAVRAVLDPLWHVPTDAAENAARILTALLANAFEHGRPPVSVLVDQGFTGALSIAVRDTGAGMPRIERGAQSGTAHPSGLMLVDDLCQMWDVQEHLGPDGQTQAKTVTAVIVPPRARDNRSTRSSRRRKNGAGK